MRVDDVADADLIALLTPLWNRRRSTVAALSRSFVVHCGGKEPDVLRTALARGGLPRPLRGSSGPTQPTAMAPQVRRALYGLARLADARHFRRAPRCAQDAEALARVLLRACGDTGLVVADWLTWVHRPIDFSVALAAAATAPTRNMICLRRTGRLHGYPKADTPPRWARWVPASGASSCLRLPRTQRW